jgi:uncharacterized protein with HEPN domain
MHNDKKRILFILSKIDDLNSYKNEYGSITKLLESKLGLDAALMCLMQIGENINKLDNQYKDLDENDIKGAYNVRNFIAHDYEGINIAIIEDIMRIYIPKLEISLKKIIKELI